MKPGVDYVGVTCVFFCHDGQGNFLLHKRSQQCKDEQGRWDCGGGALEFGEDWETAVRREVKEEYGADILELQFLRANNLLRKNGTQNTHWLALVFAAQVDPKQVLVGEPEKMDDIGWFAPDSFPTPIHSMWEEHFEYVKEAGII